MGTKNENSENNLETSKKNEGKFVVLEKSYNIYFIRCIVKMKNEDRFFNV